MGKWGFLIVIIISVVWPLIQKAIEGAEKRKKEEAIRQAQLQRSAASGAGPTAPAAPGPLSHPSAQQATPTREGRMTDLAARRKAQLEELRQRRGQSTTARVPSASSQKPAPSQRQRIRRPTAVTAPAPAPSPYSDEMTPGQLHQLGHQQDQTRRTEELKRRQGKKASARKSRHDAERLAHNQRARAADLRRQKQKAEDEAEARRKESRRQQGAYSRPADRSDDTFATNLRANLKNRNRVREAFVLKEILDLPISLRR